MYFKLSSWIPARFPSPSLELAAVSVPCCSAFPLNPVMDAEVSSLAKNWDFSHPGGKRATRSCGK